MRVLILSLVVPAVKKHFGDFFSKPSLTVSLVINSSSFEFLMVPLLAKQHNDSRRQICRFKDSSQAWNINAIYPAVL